jgi:hypothetical protein
MAESGRKTRENEVRSNTVEFHALVLDLGGPVGQKAPFDATTRKLLTKLNLELNRTGPAFMRGTPGHRKEPDVLVHALHAVMYWRVCFVNATCNPGKNLR